MVWYHASVRTNNRLMVLRNVFVFHGHLFAAGHGHRRMVQEPFGIKSRHTTRTGRRHSLPVAVVLNVATSKNSWDISGSGTVRRDQVTDIVHIQLAFENRGVRF